MLKIRNKIGNARSSSSFSLFLVGKCQSERVDLNRFYPQKIFPPNVYILPSKKWQIFLTPFWGVLFLFLIRICLNVWHFYNKPPAALLGQCLNEPIYTFNGFLGQDWKSIPTIFCRLCKTIHLFKNQKAEMQNIFWILILFS